MQNVIIDEEIRLQLVAAGVLDVLWAAHSPCRLPNSFCRTGVVSAVQHAVLAGSCCAGNERTLRVRSICLWSDITVFCCSAHDVVGCSQGNFIPAKDDDETAKDAWLNSEEGEVVGVLLLLLLPGTYGPSGACTTLSIVLQVPAPAIKLAVLHLPASMYAVQ
jgi:hypothetical protein